MYAGLVPLFSRSFSRFGIVGGLGFCIDGGLFFFLLGQDWSVVFARVLSFSCAVGSTWFLNRVWTFYTHQKNKIMTEVPLYLGTQCLGAGLNLGIFLLLTHYVSVFESVLFIPFIASSVLAFLFNYMTAKYFVFHPRSEMR